MSRDEFSAQVKRDLAARVNSCCSNPDCHAPTAGPDVDSGAINLGVAAHIRAASTGGPRYDENMSPEARGGIENGIWLCQNCAKLVDSDVAAHPPDLLVSWRTVSEHQARKELGRPLPRPFESEDEKKVRALTPLIGSVVTYAELANPGREQLVRGAYRSRQEGTLVEVNEHFLKVKLPGALRSAPLAKIAISYDDANRRLEIQYLTA